MPLSKKNFLKALFKAPFATKLRAGGRGWCMAIVATIFFAASLICARIYVRVRRQRKIFFSYWEREEWRAPLGLPIWSELNRIRSSKSIRIRIRKYEKKDLDPILKNLPSYSVLLSVKKVNIFEIILLYSELIWIWF